MDESVLDALNGPLTGPKMSSKCEGFQTLDTATAKLENKYGSEEAQCALRAVHIRAFLTVKTLILQLATRFLETLLHAKTSQKY